MLHSKILVFLLFYLCSTSLSSLFACVLSVFNTVILPVCFCSSCVLHWYPSCPSLFYTDILLLCLSALCWIYMLSICLLVLCSLHCKWRATMKESNINVWFRFMCSRNETARPCYFQVIIIMFCLQISTFMYLWAIYILPGAVCIFCCSQIGRPILGIYKSLTNTWIEELGTRPRSLQYF